MMVKVLLFSLHLKRERGQFHLPSCEYHIKQQIGSALAAFLTALT